MTDDLRIVQPTIFLIARPAFDVDAFLRFLATESLSWRRAETATASEELVEAAGRVCYMSFGKKQSPRTNREFVENLIRMGHESVLEHVSWTFLITGVSRAFTHQLVRHRVGFAFSQLSQQYHDESEATFVMPPHIAENPKVREAWQGAIQATKRAYTLIANLLGDAVKEHPDQDKKEINRAVRSAARSVLPNATETKIVITANARALRHFFRVRGAIAGDIEMRQVASELLESLRSEAPSLFFDFEIRRLPDGSPIIEHRAINDASLISSCT